MIENCHCKNTCEFSGVAFRTCSESNSHPQSAVSQLVSCSTRDRKVDCLLAISGCTSDGKEVKRRFRASGHVS